MNKKGRIIYWSTLTLGLLSIVLLLTGYKDLSIYCLILETVVLQYAMVKYIDYKNKK